MHLNDPYETILLFYCQTIINENILDPDNGK